jgi:hypothetical protein
MAIGAMQDSDGGYVTGAVYILFLETDGLVKSSQKISNWYGNLPYELDTYDVFGSAVRDIGDLDGDGVHDLVVGTPSDDDTNDDGSGAQGAVRNSMFFFGFGYFMSFGFFFMGFCSVGYL